MHAHIHRMHENILQMHNATGAALVDSSPEHQVLEDYHVYSTIDYLQQQMIVASVNPAYGTCLDHSRQCELHNNHAHSTIEFVQEEEMATCGLQAHGAVQLKEASSAK